MQLFKNFCDYEKLVNETRTKLAASEDKIANINQSSQALGW